MKNKVSGTIHFEKLNEKEIIVTENFEHLVECCGNSTLIVPNIHIVPKVTYSVSRSNVNFSVASWENEKNACFYWFLQINNVKNGPKERMREKINIKMTPRKLRVQKI